METNKLPAVEAMLGVRSEGAPENPAERVVYLQYSDQTHALCELRMPLIEAMRLLGNLQMLQMRFGLSIPPEPGGGRH